MINVNYNKKISEPIIMIAISFVIIANISYIFAIILSSLAATIVIGILSLFGGYMFTSFSRTKSSSKLRMITSIIFYDIFVSSIIGIWYISKKIPIDLQECSYLSLGSIILLSIIYVLLVKCKNIKISSVIGAVLILAAVTLVWILMALSPYISYHSLTYCLTMLGLVIFYYIVGIVSVNECTDMIKVTSKGYGIGIWLLGAILSGNVLHDFPGDVDD